MERLSPSMSWRILLWTLPERRSAFKNVCFAGVARVGGEVGVYWLHRTGGGYVLSSYWGSFPPPLSLAKKNGDASESTEIALALRNGAAPLMEL